MSKKANPALVGSFVIGAITLLIVGVMLLGGASLFDDKFECIMYFDESISGLDIGAPVDFQGVRVGTVTDVRIEFDSANGGQVLRPVKMEIESNRIQRKEDLKSKMKPGEGMQMLVENHGMRARLASQSFLTGKLKIELGFFPEQPVVLKNRDRDVWEMPTIPSAMKKVASEVAQLPLGEIVGEVHRAVRRMADIMDPELAGKVVGNMNDTLDRLEALMIHVDANIDPLFKSLTETSNKAGLLLDPNSDVRAELSLLIGELRETSKSMRRLTDYLEQHPESILRGK